MKNLVFVVLFAIIVVFSACERKSDNVVGLFTVIQKIPTKQGLVPDEHAKTSGVIRLVSSENDTISVDANFSSTYLNTRIGDEVFVLKNAAGSFGLKNTTKNIFHVGYCQVAKKESEKLGLSVVSRGGDTIFVAKVPEVVYFNTGVGDSVYVKISSGNQGYYTE